MRVAAGDRTTDFFPVHRALAIALCQRRPGAPRSGSGGDSIHAARRDSSQRCFVGVPEGRQVSPRRLSEREQFGKFIVDARRTEVGLPPEWPPYVVNLM